MFHVGKSTAYNKIKTVLPSLFMTYHLSSLVQLLHINERKGKYLRNTPNTNGQEALKLQSL